MPKANQRRRAAVDLSGRQSASPDSNGSAEARVKPVERRQTQAIKPSDAELILTVLREVRKGNFSVRMPVAPGGVMARIAPTAESTREEWDRVIGINLRGVWSCMKHELRHMERQGSGAIVNNASVGALTGNPGIGSYIASKHGVVGLTRTAALEYIQRGVRVNAVNPGLIDTQIARDVVSGDEQAYADIAKNVPIGRAGRPEEIASVVLWLCSPGASYVVGHALTVDGGMTIAP